MACVALACVAASAQVTLHFEDMFGPCGETSFVLGTESWSSQGVTVTTGLPGDGLYNVGGNTNYFGSDALGVFTYQGATISFPAPMSRLQMRVGTSTAQQTYPSFRLLANGAEVTTFAVSLAGPTLVDVVLSPPATSVVIQYITGSVSSVLIDRLFVSPYAPSTLAIAHWPMEPSVPPGVLTDVLNGHAGTLVGGATHVPGKLGQALDFHAGFAYVPDDGTLDVGTGDFSVAFWIRSTQVFHYAVVLDKVCSGCPVGADSTGFELVVDNGFFGLILADGLSGTELVATSSVFVADGVWHHVAVTVDRDDATGIRFFLDGAPAGAPVDPTAHQGTLSSPKELYVGKQGDHADTIDALLDELVLAGRVLSPSEIATLATGVELPGEVPNPWADLGAALPGTFGPPLLVGSGTLQPLSAGVLELTNAAQNAMAELFVSLASTPAHFKGGLLKPFPILLGYNFKTLMDGSFTLPFTWPASVPSDVSFYYQWAIKDTGVSPPVSLSNCVMGLTP